VRPESFDAELQERWSRWVLVHGLPELPGTELAVGQSVPVSYWVGPTTAAVAHIGRVWYDDIQQADTYLTLDFFYRVDGQWINAGDGGGGWDDEAPLARIRVAPRHADVDWVAFGVGCMAVYGPVGSEAAIAEVVQGGQVTRRPVDSAVGLLVVCGESGDGAPPFTVRVLDAREQVLAEIDAQAVWLKLWNRLHPGEEPPRRPGASRLPRPGRGVVAIYRVDEGWSAMWEDGDRHAFGPDGTWERVTSWAREVPAAQRLLRLPGTSGGVDLDTLDGAPAAD
jgi:hypothetical protein